MVHHILVGDVLGLHEAVSAIDTIQLKFLKRSLGVSPITQLNSTQKWFI